MKKIRVLFCCMGNICRSPTAHGVFATMVERAGLAQTVEVDSAGTHGYHVGAPPDPRAQETASRRGYDLSTQRARKVVADDFHRFDLILAMDRDNYRDLAGLCPRGMEERLVLFMDFAPEFGSREVPDPYYGGVMGFERVLDMVEDASRGLLAEVQRRL